LVELRPKGTGSEILVGSEIARKVRAVGETAMDGYLGDAPVGFCQHPRHVFAPTAADLMQDGEVRRFPKPLFENTTRQPHMIGDIRRSHNGEKRREVVLRSRHAE
jgi:hypothetical protein